MPPLDFKTSLAKSLFYPDMFLLDFLKVMIISILSLNLFLLKARLNRVRFI